MGRKPKLKLAPPDDQAASTEAQPSKDVARDLGSGAEFTPLSASEHSPLRGTEPPQPTPLRRESTAPSAGASQFSSAAELPAKSPYRVPALADGSPVHQHGPKTPRVHRSGVARLREMLKLSDAVSIDQLCDDACAEIERLNERPGLRHPVTNRFTV